jgi:hypothetical protein
VKHGSIIEPEEVKGLKQLIIGAIKDESEPAFKAAQKPIGSPYTINCHIVLPGGANTVFMQAAPESKKKMAFFRFDFNPNTIGPSGVDAFRDLLEGILQPNFSYADIVKFGRMTRLDVACDILGVPIADLLLSTGKLGKTVAYYGVDGVLETSYLGKKKGITPFRVYNKTQEQLDKGIDPEYGLYPHLRCEASVIPQKPLYTLAAIANPFEELDIFRIAQATPPEAHHNWVHFADSCRQRSISGALNVIPEAVRSGYEMALGQSKIGIWQPQRVWEKWGKVVAESGLLKTTEPLATIFG